MYAGPEADTADPASRDSSRCRRPVGSASTDPALANQGARSGYGRTNGLPYVEYTRGNKDFAPTWWDPNTDGPPSLGFPGGKGALWYLDNAKRYYAGHWPTEADEVLRQVELDLPVRRAGGAARVDPVHGCPSETGQGTPARRRDRNRIAVPSATTVAST